MTPKDYSQMMAHLTRPAMARGGRIGFAEGPPGLTKRQRTKAKYLESIPNYLDEKTFAALRMENSDMTNNQFAEFLNDNGYKPDTRQADNFKGTTIDRRYNVAVEKGLIPKDFVFAGSAADRAITEADVEKYKKFFLEKNKNKPEKIKKFNQLTFKQLKKRVSDQRKYDKAKQDPDFLIKKAKKGREYRAKIKAEGGEAYERYLETVAKINRENRSDRNVFYRNNRDGKSMLWEDLLKRNEEGKTKFFKYEKPLPKKQGGYYNKAITENVVLIDGKGNKYRFDTLYEDINKAGYSADNAFKPYNQKAFLYKEGLMPELNRLAGIKLGQRRNPFHIHHVSGVKKNPFDVMLTFEGANINEGNQRGGLTTTLNKILEKEKANPTEPLRYNEKKAAIQKFYSSLDPDIAVKLGKKEVGTRPKLIDMLDKTGVKLTEGQIKEATQIENNLLKLSGQIDKDCAEAVADGGRIGLQSIGSRNVCITKAKNYMSEQLERGIGTQQNAKTSLIKRILAGSANFIKQNLSPKELLKMENLIGKPALYGAAVFETGLVADDVLRKGQPLNVSAAESLFGSVLNLDADAARAKNLLKSNVQLSPAAQEYAQNILDYDKYRKLNLSFPSSLIASKMPGSDRYFKMQEELRNKIANTPETGALDYQSALDEAEGTFKAKPKFLDAPDAPEVTPLTNKLAQPSGRRIGPMTAKQDMQIDLSLPTYDRSFTASDDFLNQYLKSIGQEPLAPGEGTLFRMQEPNQRGLFGTQEKFAGGGIAKLAGISSGPPPESGPNSQGLPGLLKRVKKL